MLRGQPAGLAQQRGRTAERACGACVHWPWSQHMLCQELWGLRGETLRLNSTYAHAAMKLYDPEVLLDLLWVAPALLAGSEGAAAVHSVCTCTACI